MAKVSVVLPSRNEKFLVPTVQDLLAKAEGDLEIVVCCDGYYEHNLPADKRVKILHFGEPRGMRPGINAAIQVATGDYILKADAHTLWDQGYDRKLVENYHEDNWVVVPRRYPLDPIAWDFEKRTDNKYPIDYHWMSEPFHCYGDSTAGLHGSDDRAKRDRLKHIELDDDLSSQGSAYFMSRKHWDFLGPLDSAAFGSFWHEFQEVGLKTWLSGGACKTLKTTYYCHLFKGKRFGRGFNTRNMGHEDGTAYCSWVFMTDQPFKGKCRTMKWLIEKFAPVKTWPEDLDAIFDRARRELRNPYAAAA